MTTDKERGAKVRLRPAGPDDVRILFEWANDPVTRAASFSSEPIAWDDHVRWLQQTLTGEDRHLFIGVEGAAVSMLRLDLLVDAPGVAVVNINVSPAHRGRGIGRATLRAASQVAAQLGIERLIAEIRPTNATSIKAFTGVGYEPYSGVYGRRPRQEALCYSLSVPTDSRDRIE